MKNSRTVSQYSASDSGRTINEVMLYVNSAVFRGHGPDTKHRGGELGVIVDPLFQYDRLLKALCTMPKVRIVPFRDLMESLPDRDFVTCAIRHDVDIDIRTALALAELEHRRSIQTSYFLLHTSPYYGNFRNGIFERNGCMAHVYRQIQALSHEIALHTDPLHIYQEHAIDGAEGLRQELLWLRQEGLRITGTTAHNSVGTYGAANYAIFKGRPQSFNSDPRKCPSEVVHHGRWSPLGVLDERELGLAYEANEIFWQDHSPVRYAVAWASNKWWWESEKSVRRIDAAKAAGKLVQGFVGFEELLDFLEVTPLGTVVVLVVHPEHFGLRHSPNTGPVLRMRQAGKVIHKSIGWETHRPEFIHARSCDYAGEQESQAICFSNEHGMLDLPLDGSQRITQRLLLLGGTNIDGGTVGMPAQMHMLLSERLAQAGFASNRVWKLAYPGMGFTRHFGWYQALKRRVRPQVVILGVGADEVERSIPERWAASTGFCPHHPPGAYLHWNGTAIKVVPRSAGAGIHRRTGRPPSSSLSACASSVPEQFTEYLSRCFAFFLDELIADGVRPVVLVDECGESLGLWKPGVTDYERAEAISNLQAWLDRLVAGRNVHVVNPYTRFCGQDSRFASHWHSTQEWNHVGHRLAAQALLDALPQLLDMPTANRMTPA